YPLGPARRPTSPPLPSSPSLSLSFLNDPPTPELYPLSLHDALPISDTRLHLRARQVFRAGAEVRLTRKEFDLLRYLVEHRGEIRSEEHTSELQSLTNLVCRLLLEKKKENKYKTAEEHHISTPHSAIR